MLPPWAPGRTGSGGGAAHTGRNPLHSPAMDVATTDPGGVVSVGVVAGMSPTFRAAPWRGGHIAAVVAPILVLAATARSVRSAAPAALHMASPVSACGALESQKISATLIGLPSTGATVESAVLV